MEKSTDSTVEYYTDNTVEYYTDNTVEYYTDCTVVYGTDSAVEYYTDSTVHCKGGYRKCSGVQYNTVQCSVVECNTAPRYLHCAIEYSDEQT